MNTRKGIIALVVGSALLLLSGCGGGGEQPAATAPVSAGAAKAGLVTAVAATTTSTAPSGADLLSTFKSKDPFVQPVSNKTTSQTVGSTGTTLPGATTTTNPSQVTTHEHTLKLLSIDVANGTPVATFQVDGVVYQDKQEGASVSTSWGQVKVLSIDADSQTVILLHGSETRTLQVGQEFFK